MKRCYDIVLSGLGLLLLLPLLAILGGAVKAGDWGPVFYRQIRIGRYGRPFRICKFRTMRQGSDREGLVITAAGDARVTSVGRWLRRTKLDELPQLWNVLVGEMSLVGPRPEVPRYVSHYTPGQREVLQLMPGITDVASLEFRSEERLLAMAGNVEEFYVTQCIPRKIELNLEYARRASLWNDTKVILRTLTGC